MTDFLVVENLKTEISTPRGLVKAVDDVSFCVPRGGVLGIVGESGCGKTMTALSLMRLVNAPVQIVGGKIILEGRDILALPEDDVRKIRGKKIAMIFQDAMTSLNPVFTIGNQIQEAIHLHQNLSKSQEWNAVLESLQQVKIADPERIANSYPHELSGGMRQRAMIAMALSCKPDLLIADEPTTALDVTVQAQVLALLLEIQKTLGMSLILITHDLGVIAETVQEVLVMYAGKVVEQSSTKELFSKPKHPYTQALLKSVPRLEEEGRLKVIPGSVPSLMDLPIGCSFYDRCDFREENCKKEIPLKKIETSSYGEHAVRCIHPRNI